MDKNMEKRMYFFVPYQLTGIQQGIQAGHAAIEYANRYHNSELFQDFVNNWKTWIILNGGTTNHGYGQTNKGSLNEIYSSLINYNVNARLDDKIDVENFYEPDLNDALTAVCFICDEQVFNKELYPDFGDYLLNEGFIKPYQRHDLTKLKSQYPEYYEYWIELIGGEKNAFLKELINGKKLA